MEQLILTPVKRKDKTYKYVKSGTTEVVEKPFKSCFLLNQGQEVALTKENTLVCLKSGYVIFYDVKKPDDVTERLQKLSRPEQFLEAIDRVKSIEEQLQDNAKFCNKEEQIKILRTLGIPESKIYKCFCRYAFAFSHQNKFDVVVIDDILKNLYPEEYKDNISMSAFITNKFGKELSEKFKEYF
jgi:hypothetical protein